MKAFFPQDRSSLFSLVPLVIVNIIPLVGVLFLDWSLFQVLFLYWVESGVIGVYNIFKLIIVARLSSIIAVPFFIIHYSLFMLIHLLFIIVLFAPDLRSDSLFPSGAVIVTLLGRNVVPVLLLFISHGVSFFWNFIKGREYENTDVRKQMNAPYERVLIMHFTIIFGSWLVFSFGKPVLGVVFLIVFKTFIDVFSHLRVHGFIKSQYSKY